LRVAQISYSLPAVEFPHLKPVVIALYEKLTHSFCFEQESKLFLTERGAETGAGTGTGTGKGTGTATGTGTGTGSGTGNGTGTGTGTGFGTGTGTGTGNGTGTGSATGSGSGTGAGNGATGLVRIVGGHIIYCKSVTAPDP